jgi:Tol biopolymer transport system component
VAAASFVLPEFTKAKSEAPERNLWQLTSSGGLESEATWAPDGRTIAYSSDHAGNVDIWAQPVGEGNPVRLTSSPAQDSQPSWSRDGRYVAYRSENDGGGIFVVPATGGAERRITKFGYTPLWSPKDSNILFTSTTSASRSKLYVVDPDSGQVNRVLENFLRDFSSFRADWHPDGGRISVYGTHNRDGLSFWTVALNGTAPVRSAIAPEVTKRLKKAGVSLTDFRWAPAGDALYFVGRADEAVNIWQVRVDPRSLEWREGPSD